MDSSTQLKTYGYFYTRHIVLIQKKNHISKQTKSKVTIPPFTYTSPHTHQ